MLNTMSFRLVVAAGNGTICVVIPRASSPLLQKIPSGPVGGMMGAMAKYWITTHWPPLPDGRDIMNVYIQDKHRDAVAGMAAGDRVLIYEFQSGPNLLKRDGTVVRRNGGRAGIICEAEVATDLVPRPAAETYEQYTDGRAANWAWMATTKNRTLGFLDRSRVNAILGYDLQHRFYGFNGGRGIKELTPEDYAKLKAEFSAQHSSHARTAQSGVST